MQKNLINSTIDMPWAAGYEIRRLLALPYIRLMFALHGIAWGRKWKIWGMPMIQRYRGSTIKIGEGVLLRSWRSTNPLMPLHPVVLATRNSSAQILIKNDVGMTGTTVVAAEYIEIGNGVQIGSNSTIVDTDFHPIDPMKRKEDFLGGKHVPVFIDDDVFIGMNVLILKGAHIGKGSVIGGGSVVSGEIPAGTVAAGNPAYVLHNV